MMSRGLRTGSLAVDGSGVMPNEVYTFPATGGTPTKITSNVDTSGLSPCIPGTQITQHTDLNRPVWGTAGLVMMSWPYTCASQPNGSTYWTGGVPSLVLTSATSPTTSARVLVPSITLSADTAGSPAAYEAGTWSPDGKTLLLNFYVQEGKELLYQLYTVPLAGGSLTRLGSLTPAVGTSISWGA
jgi:hypothetical protein